MNYSRLILVMSLLGQAACSSWPDQGQGGEAAVIISEKRYLDALQHTDQTAALAQTEVLDAQTELLVLQGAERCIPASILSLRQQSLRVRRQLAASLLQDAADDISVYQYQLRDTNARFHYIRQKTHCAEQPKTVTPQSTPAKNDIAISVISVLFDHDSSVLGPGYQRHLQYIAAVLKQSNLQVQLVAHTDMSGSEADNLQLSNQRAVAVQSYLVAQGITNIQIDTVGEKEPLLQQFADEVMNRRVDIFIVPTEVVEPTANLDEAAPLLLRQWQDAGVVVQP